MTWLMVLIKNWKFTLIGILIVALVGTYFVQNLRINHYKSKIPALEMQIKNCMEANETNVNTIKKLQEELKGNNSLCEKRLKLKDETIKKLQKLCNTGEVNENTVPEVTGDYILDSLNRMFIVTSNPD